MPAEADFREVMQEVENMSGSIPSRKRQKRFTRDLSIGRHFDSARVIGFTGPFGARKPTFRFPLPDSLICDV